MSKKDKKSTKQSKDDSSSLLLRLRGISLRARENTSITLFVSLIVLLGIIGSAAALGNFALKSLSENKKKDTWAILYLEMEQAGVRLAGRMRGYLTKDIGGGATSQSGVEVLSDPQIVYRIDKGIAFLVHGNSKTPFKIEEAGLNLKATSLLQVVVWGENEYVARLIDIPEGARLPKGVKEPGRYMLLWKVPIREWIGHTVRNSKYTRVYAATREKKLLYSSSQEVSAANFEQRELVQFFIRNSITGLQSELRDPAGTAIFGFFFEVPNSNIVLFAEVPKAVALAEVQRVTTRYLIVIVLVIVLTMVLIQLPLNFVRRPMGALIKMTQKLASGDFSVNSTATGFGEIRLLASSFSSMARSLEQRDKSIRDLLVEREHRARLQKEMEIAKGIQDSLLPARPLDELSGVSVSARYIPADEVAGDWYHYHYWPQTKESVVVIADVSGHGAGSSIFTAITAELFVDTVESCEGHFPVVKFAETLNKRIFKFGKGAWHCTLAIIKFKAGDDEAEFLNAGHPPLILKLPQTEQAKMHRFPGNPVGLSNDYTGTIQRVKVPRGAFGLLYSDGLIEAKGANQRAFGTKKLVQLLSKEKSPSINGLVENTMNNWRKYTGKTKQADDICIVGFKRVA